MDDAKALDLLHLLADEEGVSMARVAKRLALGQSQLRRLVTAMGNDAGTGGMGLVEAREDGERIVLYLTRRGRDFLGGVA